VWREDQVSGVGGRGGPSGVGEKGKVWGRWEDQVSGVGGRDYTLLTTITIPRKNSWNVLSSLIMTCQDLPSFTSQDLL